MSGDVPTRLRRIGVSPERLAAMGLQPAKPAALPADLPTAAADLEAWRAYRDAHGMVRLSLYARNGAAIERGRNIEAALPAEEQK